MNTARTTQPLATSLAGLCVALWSVLGPAPAAAEPVAAKHLQTAIQTWVRHCTADAKPDAVIEKMAPYTVDGQTVAYVAHLRDGGYCLCATDDRLLPVYYYCPSGMYGNDADYGLFLREIAARTAGLVEADGAGQKRAQPAAGALAARALFWQELIAGRKPAKTGRSRTALDEPERMVLDFTPRWHQESPYNTQCPVLTPNTDQHVLLGSGVIAMAQTMYYWKWPGQGKGSGYVNYWYRYWHPGWVQGDEPVPLNPNTRHFPGIWRERLRWEVNKLAMTGYWDDSLFERAWELSSDPQYHQVLEDLYDNSLVRTNTRCTASFFAETYDWEALKDVHSDPADTNGNREVAALCYHAAVAADCRFGLDTSVARTNLIAAALEEHFRYDDDLTYEKWHPLTTNVLTSEIQWLRPVLFEGSDAISVWGFAKHGFVVIYGYDKTADPDWQFLVNTGKGEAPGWYSLDSMPCGGDSDSQSYIKFVAPKDDVKFVGNTVSRDGTPDGPYRDIQDAKDRHAEGATLIFKANSVNTFSDDMLVLDRPCTLKGWNVTIR